MTTNDDSSPFSPYEEVGILHGMIKNEFISLGIYLNQIEIFIEKQREQMQEYDFVIWSKDVMPHFKRSFILVLCGLFESKMEDVCNHIAGIKKIDVSRKDISGGVVKSLSKFFRLLGNFKEPSDDKWNILEGIYQIRNVFAHGGNEIGKTDIGSTRRLKYLQNLGVGISLDFDIDAVWKGPVLFTDKDREIGSYSGSCVFLTADFCYFSLEFFLEFLNEIKNQHLQLVSGLKLIK